MKRLLKVPFKVFWRLTGPIRRPIVRRMDATISRIFAQQRQFLHVCPVSEETGVLMDHLIRELVRLQNKVDDLQDAIAELSPSHATLGVVSMDADSDSEPKHALSA